MKCMLLVLLPELPSSLMCFLPCRWTDIVIQMASWYHINKGWQLVPSWTPRLIAETRPGFVDVPMLETDRPGAKLTLDFEGTAVGIFCVSGPAAGILEYSVDGAPFKELDTFTQWSHNLYIPWVYMLETELKDTDHKLVLRISKKKNTESQGTECQIRNFVVNP